MQFLGPYENGMKVHGWRFATSSGRNLSGSNFKGSGQYWGFLWMLTVLKRAELPSGKTYFPAESYCFVWIIRHGFWNTYPGRCLLRWFWGNRLPREISVLSPLSPVPCTSAWASLKPLWGGLLLARRWLPRRPFADVVNRRIVVNQKMFQCIFYLYFRE